MTPTLRVGLKLNTIDAAGSWAVMGLASSTLGSQYTLRKATKRALQLAALAIGRNILFLTYFVCLGLGGSSAAACRSPCSPLTTSSLTLGRARFAHPDWLRSTSA
jgi:hypothetical protein